MNAVVKPRDRRPIPVGREARRLTLEDLPYAASAELLNRLYGARGVHANGLVWYWQAGAPSQIDTWVTFSSEDLHIDIALDGDATGAEFARFDWRSYSDETRLLAWTASYEPLIELLCEVFGQHWVPERLGDCDAPSRDGCLQAGFAVRRPDGSCVVSGIAGFEAAWVSRLVERCSGHVLRTERLMNGVAARLPIFIDDVDVAPDELASMSTGAIVRLDNRSLATSAAHVVIRAGDSSFVAEVRGTRVTVLGLAPHPGGEIEMKAEQAATHESGAIEGESVSNVASGICAATVPVRLTFCMGRVALAYSDVSNVGPGYVFALDKQLDDRAITVYANDVPVAVGELVTIGDLLGVRITRTLPRA